MVRPKEMPARKRHFLLFLLCVLCYALLVGLYTAWQYGETRRDTLAAIDAKLEVAARGLKYMLPKDFHDRAVDAGAIGLDEELVNRERVSGFAFESGFAWAYTLAEKDGRFYFSAPSVSAEEAEERRSWYFLPYDDIPEEFVRAFRSGRPAVVEYRDQWGSFRSFALPETSPGGRRYLACADYDIGYLDGLLRRNMLHSVATALIFLVATTPFALLYRRLSTAHTRELLLLNRELTEYKEHLEQLVVERTAALNRAKEEAEEANAQKTQFMADVSHDLRTPLNGVMGFSDMIGRAESLDEVRELAEQLRGQSLHMLDLVDDLLDDSQIQSGGLALLRCSVDLDRLLAEALTAARVQAQAKNVSVEGVLDPGLPRWVSVDEKRLKQVLFNLLDNAVKFTEQGGVVLEAVVLGPRNGAVAVEFKVRDTGIGIPPHKLDTIFERYAKSDSDSSRRYGGTGLGLAISRHLVELMGGTIEASSRGEGKGSEFRVRLALEPAEAHGEVAPAAPADGREAQARTVRGSVLLVEDYPVNRRIAQAFLKEAGHDVAVADNGEDAVKACLEQAFDLVFMDVRMPGVDGVEATRRIRAGQGPNAATPILGLTASGDPATVRRCLEAGMNGMAFKPIQRVAFLDMVDKWLRGEGRPVSMQSRAGAGDREEAMDVERAVKEFGGNRELLLDLARGFVSTAREQLAAMRRDLDGSDMAAVSMQAHAVAGGAANLAADPLAGLARRLEAAADSRDMDQARCMLEETSAELERLVRALEGAAG